MERMERLNERFVSAICFGSAINYDACLSRVGFGLPGGCLSSACGSGCGFLLSWRFFKPSAISASSRYLAALVGVIFPALFHALFPSGPLRFERGLIQRSLVSSASRRPFGLLLRGCIYKT